MCKRKGKQLCMSKNWICSWQWISSTIHQQCSRSEKNCAKNTDIITSGPVVTFHSLRKRAEGFASVQEIVCRSFSRGCQQVPPARLQVRLQPRHRRTQKIPHFVLQSPEVRVRVVRHWETSGSPEKTKLRWGHAKSTWKPVAWYSWISGRFQRKSFGRKEFRHQGPHLQVLLKNQKQQRREKCCWETHYLYSLPEGSEFRNYAGNHDYKGSLQETHR